MGVWILLRWSLITINTNIATLQYTPPTMMPWCDDALLYSFLCSVTNEIMCKNQKHAKLLIKIYSRKQSWRMLDIKWWMFHPQNRSMQYRLQNLQLYFYTSASALTYANKFDLEPSAIHRKQHYWSCAINKCNFSL